MLQLLAGNNWTTEGSRCHIVKNMNIFILSEKMDFYSHTDLFLQFRPYYKGNCWWQLSSTTFKHVSKWNTPEDKHNVHVRVRTGWSHFSLFLKASPRGECIPCKNLPHCVADILIQIPECSDKIKIVNCHTKNFQQFGIVWM